MNRSAATQASEDANVLGDKASPTAECASNFCPVCSARLQPKKCKLHCERCGYYMSCSDYY